MFVMVRELEHLLGHLLFSSINPECLPLQLFRHRKDSAETQRLNASVLVLCIQWNNSCLAFRADFFNSRQKLSSRMWQLLHHQRKAFYCSQADNYGWRLLNVYQDNCCACCSKTMPRCTPVSGPFLLHAQ